ncbi:hypothetical protein MKW94_021312 [Papaver nudicaule]|uniref:Uncharacterized protein n=1 Tax=Papaver nudicaule TaxID=74823 RepID=A0AA41S7Z8_PAPNU|nr:hypothetical protein [Papaver nudicaule]
MATKKIHLFRQSAAEAGTPKDYYINPSEKLMSRASERSAVEHEDCIEVILNRKALGDNIVIKRYDNQAVIDRENKINQFCYIFNTVFLDTNGMKSEFKDDIAKIYHMKIKVEENNKKMN